MTAKKPATEATPAYAAATQYRVQLAARVELLGQVLYPGQDITLRGDVLAGLEPGTIAAAEALPEQDN